MDAINVEQAQDDLCLAVHAFREAGDCVQRATAWQQLLAAQNQLIALVERRERARMVREQSRPLFIPLKAEYFDAFADGRKTDELRVYGPRWNERTCVVGRGVTLSRGYGKAHRLNGRIWKFKKQHASTFGSTYRASIERVFGTLDIDIACISIELDRIGSGTQGAQEHAATTRRSAAP